MDGETKTLSLHDLERLAILDGLERHNGNRSKTALELQIGRNAVFKMLKEVEPDRDEIRALAFRMLRGETRPGGAASETIRAIHEECNRVREEIPNYEARVSTPSMARRVLQGAIIEGERSIESGDAGRMAKALAELRSIRPCKTGRKL